MTAPLLMTCVFPFYKMSFRATTSDLFDWLIRWNVYCCGFSLTWHTVIPGSCSAPPIETPLCTIHGTLNPISSVCTWSRNQHGVQLKSRQHVTDSLVHRRTPTWHYPHPAVKINLCEEAMDVGAWHVKGFCCGSYYITRLWELVNVGVSQ